MKSSFIAFLKHLIVFIDFVSLLNVFHIHAPCTFNDEVPKLLVCCGIMNEEFRFLVPIS